MRGNCARLCARLLRCLKLFEDRFWNSMLYDMIYDIWLSARSRHVMRLLFNSFCKGCYLGRVGATRITRFWNCFAMCVLLFGPETISCKMWHVSNMCHLQCNKNFRGNQRQIQRPLANVTSTISWIMMTMWLNYKKCGNRCPNWGKQYPKDYCSVHFDSLVKKRCCQCSSSARIPQNPKCLN